MKTKNSSTYLHAIFLLAFGLLTYWHFRSPIGDPNPAITDENSGTRFIKPTAGSFNDTIVTKSKNRYQITGKPQFDEFDDPLPDLINEEGELNEKTLESLGIGKDQIDSIRRC